MNLRSVRGFCKAAKRPYMKLFTSDYRDGTARLTFELQGFYARVLTLLHDGETVPSDPKKLGVMMQCDPRMAGRLARGLIDAGKLYEKEGTLRNKRVDRDIAETSDEDRGDIAETSPELPPDISETSGRTFQKSESNQHAENRTMEKATSTATSIAIAKEDSVPNSVVPRTPREAAALPSGDELYGQLIEACNGSLDNPVNCLGLLSVATPTMWLAQGCDLQLDVLPTLRAAGTKYHGKRIRDWGYFTGMVAEAKAKRERGLPAIEAPAAPIQKISEARATLERRKALEVHA